MERENSSEDSGMIREVSFHNAFRRKENSDGDFASGRSDDAKKGKEDRSNAFTISFKKIKRRQD